MIHNSDQEAQMEAKARARRRPMGSVGHGKEEAAPEERAADSATLKV